MSVQVNRYLKLGGMGCFNTSYVSVQDTALEPLKSYQNSFNTSYVSVQALEDLINNSIDPFQYILCVGSR